MDRRIVITGCSRSATRYTAELLTAAGLPFGHEAVFGPFTGALHLTNPFAMQPSLRGDSSFMAVPYLHKLREGDCVFHQVREPLAVLRSHVGIRFFARTFAPSRDLAATHPYYLAIINDFRPEIFAERFEVSRTALYWVVWNEAVETGCARLGLRYERYRVEDVDLAVLERIAAAAGVTLSREAATRALTGVSRTVNARTRDDQLGWAAVRDLSPDLQERFTTLCARYGYQVPSLVHT